MFDGMKQFLISETCLSCEGCCQFDKEKSDWRPKVGKIEESLIRENVKFCNSKEIIEEGGYVKDKLCHGVYACEFLKLSDRTCGIYSNRPFECRLYPFVLTQWNKKPSVCVHLPCPYIEKVKGSKHYVEYVNYLRELFTTVDVKKLLKNNPHLFGAYVGYEDELEWVFNISI